MPLIRTGGRREKKEKKEGTKGREIEEEGRRKKRKGKGRGVKGASEAGCCEKPSLEAVSEVKGLQIYS